MTAFEAFFKLGIRHIADPEAYDHLLFVITLCAFYNYRQWYRLAWLVTAFTVGHSVTLALCALDLIRLPSNWIEILIPVTIMLTALYNISVVRKGLNQGHRKSKIRGNYILALAFGLVHGMGFSNYLRSIMSGGNLTIELLSFNLGLEVGQLFIVMCFLLLYFVLDKIVRVDAQYWNHFWSGAGFAVALTLLIDFL